MGNAELWSGLIAFLVVPTFAALLTLPARADVPLPALVVTRSAGATDCPDAASLAAEVARMNARPSLDASGNPLSTTRHHVELNRGLEGYSAVIRALGARSGERPLTDVGPTLRQGNLSSAFAELEVARSEFPRGALGEEREALTIELLARSGQRDAARQRGEAFLPKFSQRAYTANVRKFVF